MKFLISSAFNEHCHYGPSFKRLHEITSPVTQEYCNAHGYEYIVRDVSNYSRNASWGKVQNVYDNLSKYDWAWSIDIDGMIMNHNIRLEDIIDPSVDIIIATRENKIENVNGGSILFKNSRWTNLFLEKMFDYDRFIHKGFWEQSTLIDFLNGNVMDCQNHIKMVPNRRINSFYHCWFKNDNFRIGDLYCHFVGSNNDYREDVMEKFKSLIIKHDKSLGVEGIDVFWGDIPH